MFVDIKWTYATIQSQLEYTIKTAFERTNMPYTAAPKLGNVEFKLYNLFVKQHKSLRVGWG